MLVNVIARINIKIWLDTHMMLPQTIGETTRGTKTQTQTRQCILSSWHEPAFIISHVQLNVLPEPVNIR